MTAMLGIQVKSFQDLLVVQRPVPLGILDDYLVQRQSVQQGVGHVSIVLIQRDEAPRPVKLRRTAYGPFSFQST